MNHLTYVWIRKRVTPDHAWKWLLKKVNLPEDYEGYVKLISNSDLLKQLEEQVRQ